MTHSEYPVLRKMFLQWMFVERLVPLSAAENFFKEMIEAIDFGSDENKEKDFNNFIDFCKNSLTPINFGLKKQIFVRSDCKMEYLGICNIHSDIIAQTATKLSPENIENFKKIIDAAKDASNHGLGFMEIEQIIKGSKTYIQFLINELVTNEWIFFNQSQGQFFIGPRTLLELSDYLKEVSEAEEPNSGNEYIVFRDCDLCSSIICCGAKVQCLTTDCKTIYHQLCINEYSNTIGKSNCPKCQKSIDKI